MSKSSPIIIDERRARDIVLAEYSYWQSHDGTGSGDDSTIIALGAAGACANIVAALSGHLAPWHKEFLEKKEAANESRHNS